MDQTSERTPEQLKHLEFAQANIARMHDAATSMKRFALTAFALGGSLARFLHEPMIVFFTLVVVAGFFVLDAKYLQTEKAFTDIFNRVKDEPVGAAASFDLTPRIPTPVPLRELLSWSTWILYGPIIAILILLWAFVDW